MKRIIQISIWMVVSAITHGQSMDTASLSHSLDSLLKIAKKARDNNQFEEALQWNGQAIHLLSNQPITSDSLLWSSVFFNRGRIFYVEGKYVEAIPWLDHAVRIIEKEKGHTNQDFFNALEYLSKAYRNNEQYFEAEKGLIRLLACKRELYGTIHKLCAQTQIDLGRLYYYHLGYFAAAEAQFEEVRSVLEQTIGKMDPEYAYVLKKLADLASDRDDHETAESLYFEGLAILEKTIGTENNQYAQHLNNVGILHVQMGNYAQAEKEYLVATNIRFRVEGKESFYFAQSLNNIGLLYIKLEQFERADSILEEARAIVERVLGKDHEDYAMVLQNLGVTNKKLKRYAIAEECLKESLRIYERKFGNQHPEYLHVVPDLATLYKKEKKYTEAEKLYLQFLAGWEEKVGRSSGAYLDALKDLSELYWSVGNQEKTIQYVLESFELEQSMLKKATRHLSEHEMSFFIRQHSSSLNRLISLTRQIPELSGPAYDNILFYKGFLQNAAIQTRRYAHQDSIAYALDKELRQVSAKLSNLYAKPRSLQNDVTVLEQKAAELEKSLAKRVSGYHASVQNVSWQEVQNKLHHDEAAIEFVRYKLKKPKDTDTVLYAALLILPDGKNPRYVSLFEESEMLALLKAQGDRKVDYVNHLYTHQTRSVKPMEVPVKSLRDLVWAPLKLQLPEYIRTLYFAPAGLLHRINLAALPINEFQTLADSFHCIQINSTRQLVLQDTFQDHTFQATLFGGIDFESDSIVTTPLTESTEGLMSRSLSVPFKAQENGAGAWNYLPGTDREVASIEQIIRQSGETCISYRGKTASEEAFKSLALNHHSPRVIHLATHGFFFPDEASSDSEEEKSVFQKADQPMLRSGLLFAGANNTWMGVNDSINREDGILTAYEIGNLDLSQTELVVLSACETGLGDIKGNEGVYGLQRAFKIAGVRYLIMSLWQIPDKQTGILMSHFYRQWLLEKKPIPEAFQVAQKSLRDAGLDPYYWAGFILVE